MLTNQVTINYIKDNGEMLKVLADNDKVHLYEFEIEPLGRRLNFQRGISTETSIINELADAFDRDDRQDSVKFGSGSEYVTYCLNEDSVVIKQDNFVPDVNKVTLTKKAFKQIQKDLNYLLHNEG